MIAATQSNHPLAGFAGPSTLEDARNRITQAKMRITKPRVAIIETLLRHGRPVSIENLHQMMGPDVCDLVTVYRCLSAFENIGMVHRSYLHSGTCLYELTLGTQRHYHILCKACGESAEVEYFPVEGVERALQDRGYAQVTHVVSFFGICPACQAAARSAEHPAITRAMESLKSVASSEPSDL